MDFNFSDETGIGYFPDVGGTYALPRAPHSLGFWLGQTGATVGAADVIAAELADAMIPSGAIAGLLSDLAAGLDPAQAIANHAADPDPSRLRENATVIDACFGGREVADILAALTADGSAFATETLDLLARKSPTSLVLTLHLLRAGAASPDLESCLDRELAGDALILKGHDFYEGVRAAVIDKDRNPQWSPACLDQVDPALLIASLHPLPSRFPATRNQR